ncbi:MAG: hypothetical protein A2664_01415 [Candidatus Taylorbacteria bacterium RIFCSPHIGHO2_01_FULL_46_22b]|uniref:Putative pre-16S rRNA nuclease n=1 Tax=Candidatus Taylorbacteria bacterium RIFCSPHIGHO2_01_FULL_46_22b TaxID=1802301 RepID=A0A1G2M269_9BACT|nr:MAG: hypothetical protein A2664_01415 [Candidatus Taylorbacteria bacterium RIFCSPHIGHO2_01_FULL_46_22b]
MRLVGVDYGLKRVGIAISDGQGDFALPYAVWPADDKLLSKIKALCVEKEATAIVIGESRDLDGRPNDIMRDILLFKSALEREMSSTPVYLEPEFFTTVEAERIQGRHNMTDASAAALILKSYLARHSHGNH